MRMISKSVVAALMTAGMLTSASAQSTLTLGMVVGTTGAFAGGEAPLVNPHACADYAAVAADKLDERLASEAEAAAGTRAP